MVFVFSNTFYAQDKKTKAKKKKETNEKVVKEKKENQPYWIYGKELMEVDKIWENFINEHLTQNFYDKAVEILSPLMKELDPNYITNLGKNLDDCNYSLAENGRADNPSNKKIGGKTNEGSLTVIN